MEKKKKRRIRRILGLTVGELCAFTTVLGAVIGSVAGGVHYLDGKFASIDRRFDQIETRLDRVEARLDEIEIKLNNTSDLLDSYLTWRFIHVNDPLRKNLVPRYDPSKRTLEFVDKRTQGK
jgi:hypothetical protein